LIHIASQNLIDKFDAKDIPDLRQQYVDKHPEYGCDTWTEFIQFYPVLSSSLSFVFLN
jgi:hypothetical protein